MKATGIVRRIDDLGRIVIPKEIRRTQRIREGDPIEIFTNREGEIMLKKYSPIGDLSEFAADYAESLAQTTGGLACVTDRDMVIAAAGPKKKEFEGKPLTKELEHLMEKRGSVLGTVRDGTYMKLVEDAKEDFEADAVSTIICNGDCIGAVALCGKLEESWKDKSILQLVQTAGNFLGRQLES